MVMGLFSDNLRTHRPLIPRESEPETKASEIAPAKPALDLCCCEQCVTASAMEAQAEEIAKLKALPVVG
jgi:hypothetical protein